MSDLLNSMSSPFMPHGHCYLWQPAMVWLHATTDTVIFISYLAISCMLVYLTARLKEVPFRWIYVLFGTFIFACGVTHLFEVLNIWVPAYWSSGAAKLITAIASMATAALLPAQFPKIRHLAQGAALREAQVALVASERRYRQLLETAYEGVWVIDNFAKTEYVNPRMAAMLGYSVGEMLHKPIFDFMDESLKPTAMASLERRKAGETGTHDFRWKKKTARICGRRWGPARFLTKTV